MTHWRWPVVLVTGLIAMSVALKQSSHAQDGPTMDIVGTAQGAGTFQTLVQAVTAAGLVETLQSHGPFTVFAPDDDAFAKLDPDLLQALLDNPDKLTEILTFHVVSGQVLAADIVSGADVPTANGQSFQITLDAEDNPVIGDAAITQTDILASNGVIHVIDTVLIPEGFTLEDGPTMDIVETAQAAGTFQTLVQAVTAAGLVETLQGDGPFTVFAPDDDAFAKLDPDLLQALLDNPDKLAEVLTFHVVAAQVLAADIVPGAEVPTVNGQSFQITLDAEDNPVIGDAAITQTDILASNGVIHVIDTVLIPEGFTLEDGPTMDIIETAQAAGTFQTLVQAVTAAGLVETLQGDGPFTVFAPDDDAFAKLDPDLLQALLDNPDKLAEVLTFHVLAAQVLAADIVPGAEVPTVNGQSFQITLDAEDNPVIGDAAITQTDILASNGVIHVIDTVLIPEGFTLEDGPTIDIVETAQAAGTFQTLVQAVTAAGLVETLQGDGPFTVFAPDDDAFAKLDPDLLQALLDNPDKLAEVLTFHVVAAQVLAADIVPGAEVPTANGQSFQITLDAEDNPVIGDAAITQTDILASNGVIHVIDTVLIPEGIFLESETSEPGISLNPEEETITIQFSTEDGVTYQLRRTTDWITWEAVQTVTATETMTSITLMVPDDSPVGFYRIVQLPFGM